MPKDEMSLRERGEAALAAKPQILPRKKPIENSELALRFSHELDVIDAVMDDAELAGKLLMSNLSQIGIFRGITVDKLLATQGMPSMIIGHHDQARLDELAPAIIAEMKRRGLQVTQKLPAIDVEVTPIGHNSPP